MTSTRVTLWIAQGFGTGRAPFAPGTVGSLLGLPWFALLLWPAHSAVFLGGILVSCLAAIPLCSQAESILHQKDPGSVVLDEIVAVPLCYLGWWILDWTRLGHAPSVANFCSGRGWVWLLAGFVLFRVLDALKPPPIYGCQRLPAGWGIVADDVVAGALTGLLLGLLRWLIG